MTQNVVRILCKITIVPIVAAIAFHIFALCLSLSYAATTDTKQEVQPQSTYSCDSLDLHIESTITEDIQDICTAGLAVASFYRDAGFLKIPTMHITMVDNIPQEVDTNVLGCFAPKSGEIRILSFLAASKCGNWFGRHIDRALYQSLTAHEIAHAFASYNASVEKLSVRAGEYVAYVVMFATMDHDHRQKILEDCPGTGFETDEQISSTYYYLSPCQFGVNAYRHFLRPENGIRFFVSVIHGQALID